MKKVIPVIVVLSSMLNVAFPQRPLVLTYETHALRPGANNSMILCNYADPGFGGENVIWDFSQLESTNHFTGTLLENNRLKTSEAFNKANTTLDEFNNRFYLTITRDQIEQIGFSTLDNSVAVTYHKPFVKMKFPFSMGDRYKGDFSGSMRIGRVEYPLSGSYEVMADGYGKLILPGNITVENTLRVNTLKSYEMEVNGSRHYTEINTCRWYGCCNRYPLLVLTTIKTTVASSVTLQYQAAYNNVINDRLHAVDDNPAAVSLYAFPNPAADLITLEYAFPESGEVTIDIYSNTGKKITTLVDERLNSGSYRLQLSPLQEGLSTGVYFIRARFNQTFVTEEIVFTK